MKSDPTDRFVEEIGRAVWLGSEVKPFINDGDIMDEAVQKNGIDLTIDKIIQLMGCPSFSHNKDYEERCVHMEIEPQSITGLDSPGWNLGPGEYVIQWNEKIKIPTLAIGLLLPRSSMLRNGITINGAVWDRGYEGKGQSLMIVGSNGVLIERFYRAAQMIFIGAIDDGESYEGQYQGENLYVEEKEENKD